MTLIPQYRPNIFRPDPKKEKVEKKKVPYKFKPKNSGQLDLFKKIWQERGPYSQISGEYLGEFNVSLFAHVLPKAKNKYPLFKLNPQNIIIISIAEHFLWDNARYKCTDPKWKQMFELENALKEKYKTI